MTSATHAPERVVRGNAWSTAVGVWRGVRPRQWTKNALLAAALLFAGKVGSWPAWLEAATAFAAYCAISGAAYLVNDVRDRDADRAHPVKRLRPVASGILPVPAALTAAVALAAGGVALTVTLGLRSVALALAFATLQTAYSLALKRVAFVDVLTIAALFVVRASAGAAAVHVRVSPWLVVCTALLATFLGFAKRRAELALVAAGRAPGRAVLVRYPPRATDRLVWAAAAATLLGYTAYAGSTRTSPEMLLTVPFVAAGIARYVHLVRARGAGEEPEAVLLSDWPIVAAVAGWTVTAAVLLATT